MISPRTTKWVRLRRPRNEGTCLVGCLLLPSPRNAAARTAPAYSTESMLVTWIVFLFPPTIMQKGDESLEQIFFILKMSPVDDSGVRMSVSNSLPVAMNANPNPFLRPHAKCQRGRGAAPSRASARFALCQPAATMNDVAGFLRKGRRNKRLVLSLCSRRVDLQNSDEVCAPKGPQL